MDKRLQGCVDILNGCIQCGECKHLAYVEDVDYMECSLGVEENTKGKCEKFEKSGGQINDSSRYGNAEKL